MTVGDQLNIDYPVLPPSSNHIYYNRPGGGRALTTKADNWQKRFVAFVGQHYIFSIRKFQDVAGVGAVFTVEICLRLELADVVNKGWVQRYKKDTWVGKKGTSARRMKRAGQRKAETRYKRLDVSNRFKLLEDSASLALGVGDLHHFGIGGSKIVVDDDAVGVTVVIVEDDPRAYGIPEEYLDGP